MVSATICKVKAPAPIVDTTNSKPRFLTCFRHVKSDFHQTDTRACVLFLNIEPGHFQNKTKTPLSSNGLACSVLVFDCFHQPQHKSMTMKILEMHAIRLYHKIPHFIPKMLNNDKMPAPGIGNKFTNFYRMY